MTPDAARALVAAAQLVCTAVDIDERGRTLVWVRADFAPETLAKRIRAQGVGVPILHLDDAHLGAVGLSIEEKKDV